MLAAHTIRVGITRNRSHLRNTRNKLPTVGFTF